MKRSLPAAAARNISSAVGGTHKRRSLEKESIRHSLTHGAIRTGKGNKWRKKKQYRLQMDFLFLYTKRIAQGNVGGGGFSSFPERTDGSLPQLWHCLPAYDIGGLWQAVGVPWHNDCKGVAAGAYKEGVGWIHWGLKLAADYGIYGEALREKTAEDLKRELDAGHPCMVSVTLFQGQKAKPKPDGSSVLREKRAFGACACYETRMAG